MADRSGGPTPDAYRVSAHTPEDRSQSGGCVLLCIDAWAWLAPEPVDLDDREAAVEYLLAGVLAPYVADRPAGEQRKTVADRLGEPHITFARFSLLARRAR
ncbi:MAG: hypothetical protein ACQSGP_14435 [Frankia sp.]